MYDLIVPFVTKNWKALWEILQKDVKFDAFYPLLVVLLLCLMLGHGYAGIDEPPTNAVSVVYKDKVVPCPEAVVSPVYITNEIECPEQVKCPEPVPCPEIVPCPELIICPECPKPPLVVEDLWTGTNDDSSDDNNNDDDNDDDDDDDCGGHGHDHGGHGSHGGHGHGHRR